MSWWKWVLLAVALIGGGYWGYTKFKKEPKNTLVVKETCPPPEVREKIVYKDKIVEVEKVVEVPKVVVQEKIVEVPKIVYKYVEPEPVRKTHCLLKSNGEVVFGRAAADKGKSVVCTVNPAKGTTSVQVFDGEVRLQ